MDEAVQQGIEAAVTRSILAQMSGDVLERLLAEVWAQHRDELQAQALAAVREEHAQALEDLEERLRDRTAKERAELERDADRLLEVTEAQLRTELADEYADRLERLRGQRNEARQERDTATHVLLDLVRQLVGQKPTYLHSRGLAELDLYRLNLVLAKHGLRLRSRRTASERQVQTRLDLTRVEPRSLFWLESVPVGAPPDEDDDETDEETPPDAPALPPAAEEVR